MRFQPIVSCRGTYQDAVSVPCLGAPFIRCIWTVGSKKCAVTVPTLRPLGLLEMRKSRLCVCAPGWAHPRVPHGGQSCSWSFSPCQGSSPGSSSSSWCLQRLLLSRTKQSLALLRAALQLYGLLCQLILFPREKLLFLADAGAFTCPCSRGAPAPCPCGRQHKGALWEALWGQELAQHSSHCSSRALAKHKGQNVFPSDRRKTILFEGETLELNLNFKTKLAVVVSYWYLNHLAGGFDIFFFVRYTYFLNYFHCLCYILCACFGVWLGKGQGGTGRDTRMDTGQTTTWKSFDCIHFPLSPHLHLTRFFLPTKDIKPHQSYWYTLQPPKIYLAIFTLGHFYI